MANQASSYPSKPIKMIVPFAPGGSNDMVARIVGPKFSEIIGAPVIIENKSGAGGSVGAAYAAQAANDGYTILMHSTTVTMQPWLMKNPGYELFKDFDPVTRMTTTPFTLVVSSPIGVNNYKELAKYAKESKKELFFGSAGTASSPHLVAEYFKSKSAIDMEHVPYKGNGPMMVALMGNEIQLGFDTIHSSKPMAESGRIKILAVTSLGRNKNIPDVPTLDESGLPGFDVGVWQGVFMPKGADPAKIDKVQKAMAKTLQDPDVVQKLNANGFDVVASTPADFTAKIKADMEVWSKVIKDIGYKPE
jgi:tripartite-type tricarboxylate transporter receptor subunit TctC